jgi:hypothetical protein
MSREVPKSDNIARGLFRIRNMDEELVWLYREKPHTSTSLHPTSIARSRASSPSARLTYYAKPKISVPINMDERRDPPKMPTPPSHPGTNSSPLPH